MTRFTVNCVAVMILSRYYEVSQFSDWQRNKLLSKGSNEIYHLQQLELSLPARNLGMGTNGFVHRLFELVKQQKRCSYLGSKPKDDWFVSPQEH